MNIIRFPKNKDVFLQKATRSFEEANMTEAILYMEKAIQETQDTSLYTIYIATLLESHELDKALAFFKTYLPNIQQETQDIEWDSLYIRLLLELWDLETASSTLEKKTAYYEQYGLSTYQLEVLSQRLNQQHIALKNEEEEMQQQLMIQLEKVEALSFLEQRSLLPMLNILSVDAYIEQAMYLLCTEQFHPLLKSYLLEMLCERQYTQDIDMVWFGEKQSVSLTQLVPVLEHPIYQRMDKYVDNMAIDEQNKQVLQQNILLYVSMLYPFIERVIDDEVAFVHALQEKHVAEKQHVWIDRLEKEIQKMTM
ncbi:hypothetical protein KG091_03145 [Carnobacteriaceae bacterium zg-ZUI78]|nr:hypothetical protein [Carnobacteriaceae bacterium zg-ZUI78]